MSTSNGGSPIPFDTSANVSFTGTPSPVPQIQGQYNNLEKGYSGAINGQATVPQLTGKYNDQFGVPQLQGQVQNYQAQADSLGTQINNVPKTIAQASQQSIMTQGQKDAATQAMQAPLQQQLGTLNTNLSRTQSNLGTAQTNAGNMVQAEQAQQTKQLLPWTQAFSDQNVTSAMQMTGWTTENAQQLQVLLANQSAGVSLTKDEQDNLEQLAQQEQSFEDTLKVNAANSQSTLSNDESLASYNANLKAKAAAGTGSGGAVLQAPASVLGASTQRNNTSNSSGLSQFLQPVKQSSPQPKPVPLTAGLNVLNASMGGVNMMGQAATPYTVPQQNVSPKQTQNYPKLSTFDISKVRF